MIITLVLVVQIIMIIIIIMVVHLIRKTPRDDKSSNTKMQGFDAL